jgi:hypothetical protein
MVAMTSTQVQGSIVACSVLLVLFLYIIVQSVVVLMDKCDNS